MFEHRSEPLLPRPQFYLRVARSIAVGSAVVVVSLLAGMTGYRVFEHRPWLDAFLNAAMLLAGEGPIGPLQTPAGKLFAGCYAIYCGITLITTTAVILSPVLHRAVHKFHLDDEDKN